MIDKILEIQRFMFIFLFLFLFLRSSMTSVPAFDYSNCFPSNLCKSFSKSTFNSFKYDLYIDLLTSFSSSSSSSFPLFSFLCPCGLCNLEIFLFIEIFFFIFIKKEADKRTVNFEIQGLYY
jgi:hypothetical protein